MRVAFVSVNKSYESGMDSEQLRKIAYKDWAFSLSVAKSMDFVVAVFGEHLLIAWPVIDAFTTDDTFNTKGGLRPKIGFVFGAPVPIRPDWVKNDMRRGITYSEFAD